MNVKKNDTVIVLSGKDKGKKGKVLEAMPAAGKVVVEGVKVMLVCPKCGKATRHAVKLADGKKVRVCKKCGQTI